jgi:(p)ppGpp synthase/HD superfamily hydrolase
MSAVINPPPAPPPDAGRSAPLLERAIEIAVQAHHGQRDRNGLPYLLHPLRVMCRVETIPQKIVAVLHDVVEDTAWTFADLEREGFSAEILKALDCVTKREGEPYEEFVGRSAADPLARRVKVADLEDNMDIRRGTGVTPEDADRLRRYLAAWRKLAAEP